uniref:hypothetical protein n=1 Tax=uncultured Acinetobacter sp. TaxID=165433 RepID=UPI00261CA7E9|nr:hypothetical protein [uncultured Acinetobacter sp.]
MDCNLALPITYEEVSKKYSLEEHDFELADNKAENSNYKGYPYYDNDNAKTSKPALHYKIKNRTGLLNLLDLILNLEIKDSEKLDLDLNHSFSSTEKEALINARIGQQNFRKSLLDYWKGCSVTGCNFEPILVASHIKGEFKHEVRQFEKSYDNQQAEQISLMV